MYIKTISLKNIRGFESLDFDLQRPDGSYAGWTVFTGGNGSGKSTLLKAIAIGLMGRDNARGLQPSFNGWIRKNKLPTEESSVSLGIVPCKPDEIYQGPPIKRADFSFPLKLEFKNGGKETRLETAVPPSKPKGYKTPDINLWSSDAAGWVSCGYGSFRRVFGESSSAQRQMSASATGHFVTLFDEGASLSEANEWMRLLDHKRRESDAAAIAQLDLLLRMLGMDLLPKEFSVDRVDSNGLWLKDKDGVEVSWSAMSDGFRSTLAMVADILRHLIVSYGHADLSAETEEMGLHITRSGVILIDEVDVHLHPEWQREMGFWLKRRFPYIQFLVTTHSPIICQAADPNGLFYLPSFGSDRLPVALDEASYRQIIAARPDTILLSPAFGMPNTRSPKAADARQEYATLANMQRGGAKLTAAEKRRLKELTAFAQTDEPL